MLIVDDEGDVNESLQAILERRFQGLKVTSAQSADEGLAHLARQRFSLVIADYIMPRMDGIAFLERVRRQQPGVPRVLITAYPDSDVAFKALKGLGIQAVITKPFDLDHLFRVVSDALGQPLRTPARP